MTFDVLSQPLLRTQFSSVKSTHRMVQKPRRCPARHWDPTAIRHQSPLLVTQPLVTPFLRSVSMILMTFDTSYWGNQTVFVLWGLAFGD